MIIMNTLSEKRVLILGLGREGMNTFSFLRKLFPEKVLGLADKARLEQLDEQTRKIIKSDGRVMTFLGEDYLKSMEEFEVIFKAPGIPPAVVEGAKQAGKIITSNTAAFFECCPGKIIGITGTKGKSTTTSLIYEVLKAGGIHVQLAGNIGIPPLSSLDEAMAITAPHPTPSDSLAGRWSGPTSHRTCVNETDSSPVPLFVLELSSAQLADLRTSPHVSVIQNISPAHLDYHETFENYVEAKQNIARYQGPDDYCLFNAAYPIPTTIANASQAKKIPFALTANEARSSGEGCFVDDGLLTIIWNGQEEKIIAVDKVPLRGAFNLQNVMPSIIVGKLWGIPTKIIAQAIQHFQSLEHRLEFVETINGVSFYNDSLATLPDAAIGAIKAFPQKNIVLLAGGYDRGLDPADLTDLAQIILNHQVKALILFPSTGQKIWQEIIRQTPTEKSLPQHFFVEKMPDAVKFADSCAEPGDIVLLSPASPSFGLFKDYRDRGWQFKAEVKKLCNSSGSPS